MGSIDRFYCPLCGYSDNIRIGIGLSYPDVRDKLKEEILSDKTEKYKDVREAMKRFPDAELSFHDGVYVCDKCQSLFSARCIELLEPKKDNKTSARKSLWQQTPECPCCSSPMRKTIFCPRCKRSPLKTQLLAHWD